MGRSLCALLLLSAKAAAENACPEQDGYACASQSLLQLHRSDIVHESSVDEPKPPEILFQAPELTDRNQWPDLWKEMGMTHGAEVGVWKGDFAQNTLKKMPALQEYILVDPWRHLGNWNKPFNVNDQFFTDIYKQAMSKTLESPLGAGKVRVLRGTSAEIIHQVNDNSLDFVYVDGDHELKGAILDLMLWYRKVAPGGLISGDDYVDSAQHGGKYAATHVKSAVDAFAEVVGSKVRNMGLSQFGFIKPQNESDSFDSIVTKVMKKLWSKKDVGLTEQDLNAAQDVLKQAKLLK
jgi:hypothetical protein